jgi:hypothetical protein
MPQSESRGRAFSVERCQRLLVETDGHTQETREVFVKVYRDMAASGLLAQLSGNELKVLLVLGLEAKVLGGNAEAERHFERLTSFGAVTRADRGRLFCYLDRNAIAERTGLSTRTVSTAGTALVQKRLIEKRSVRNRSGQHDYNVYFIRPASHLGKFGFNRRPFDDSQEPNSHRGQILPTVDAMGTEPPTAGFPHLKNGRSGRGSGMDLGRRVLAADPLGNTKTKTRTAGQQAGSCLDAEVFARFAERQNVDRYVPTERDVCGLARARSEGYSQDQILASVDKAFDGRSMDAEPIRRFTYCLPILRSWADSPEQLQSVPSGSPVASQHTEEDIQDEAQTTPAPTVALVASTGTEARSSPAGEAVIADEWEAEMEHVFQKVGRAGWPLSATLQTALRAKAVRVDDVAREQEAHGPAWAGDALLLALGRKMGKNGRPAPTDEELLAYADGILDNWAQRGRPRARKETQSVCTAHERAIEALREGQAELSEGQLVPREPRSKEEEFWREVLDDLRLQMTRATFDQWLRGSELLELHQPDEGVAHIVVGVASDHAVDWLEHRLLRVIRRTVERRLGQGADLTFQARDDRQARDEHKCLSS